MIQVIDLKSFLCVQILNLSLNLFLSLLSVAQQPLFFFILLLLPLTIYQRIVCVCCVQRHTSTCSLLMRISSTLPGGL